MSLSKQSWLAATGGLPDNDLHRVTKTVPSPGRFAHDLARAVFLDTETDAIVRGEVPAPRIACTCDIKGRNRRTYRPAEFHGLAKNLRRASVVITFNGDGFDFKVIARHLKTGVQAIGAKSFDLMATLKRASGWPHNLNNLAYVNLKQTKSCWGAGAGRPIEMMERDCRSDVEQLRRLLLLFLDGKLKVPAFPQMFTKKAYRRMPFGGRCPRCRDIACINELEPEQPDKEWDAAILSAAIGNHEACRALVGVGPRYRCFTCGLVFANTSTHISVPTDSGRPGLRG